MTVSFDLKALAEQLSRVFPDLVTLRGEFGDIIVMGRIRVTTNGVVEGTGPAADKVRAICAEFSRQQSQEAFGPLGSRQPDELDAREGRLRCQHCGLALTSRIYKRRIAGSLLFFCCKSCADHQEAEPVNKNTSGPIA